MSCSRSVVPAFSSRFLAAARNDILCHPERSFFFVTIDAAAGGVKDLEYHTVSR
ncbi:MAG: hypothetical protein IAC06_08065 [Bacteroidetes bacterium]|uniref:Uncharacterized protein n=1 Tax=Candidatus Cryptobacteroides intestinavium TaxID=2840766 RepID=A0A9D9F0E3_9BACT|nr:hypothetical protein [Candidatus Cryptobacteroides intestinavium]